MCICYLKSSFLMGKYFCIYFIFKRNPFVIKLWMQILNYICISLCYSMRTCGPDWGLNLDHGLVGDFWFSEPMFSGWISGKAYLNDWHPGIPQHNIFTGLNSVLGSVDFLSQKVHCQFGLFAADHVPGSIIVFSQCIAFLLCKML